MASEEQLKQYLEQNNQEPYYVLKMIGKRASKWKLYPTETNNKDVECANQMQILKTWVLWDIDPPKTNHARDRSEESKKQCEKITTRLRNDNKNYKAYWSGNIGNHVLAIFPQLIQYTPSERQWLKRQILKKYGWDANYEDAKSGSKTPIQIPNTPHRKTLYKKELISWCDDHEENNIPQEILNMLEIRRVTINLRKELRELNKEDIKITLKEALSIPPCIQYFRDANIEEGHRDQVLFSLISHLKHQYDMERLIEEVEEWTSRHNNFLDKQAIMSKINSANRTPFKTTCHYNKELVKSLDKKEICNNCIHNIGD